MWRAALLGLALTGCVMQRALEASEAQSKMVGLSKEQVLTCMGAPASQASAGETEVWAYGSGNGYTSGVATYVGGLAFGHARTRYCMINIVMVRGRVSRVNYSGSTGPLLAPGEQCAFAIHNCVAQ
ncbi:hypothetical protein SAMN05444161_5291 [Rhizobiales bacterium GAS191]|nr:hypothetical protein SAMN05444161_5291 [Rhizobiales bacterium GAS191]